MKIKIITLITLTLFPILSLFYNIKGWIYNCFNAYDLGIYPQGIFEIAAFNSFNPYITFRDANTLNDHFTPIVYLAAPFAWISNFNVSGLIIFEWLCYISALLIILRLKKNWTLTEYIISVFMIIFCKGLLAGLSFPIHPDVWAIPVWFLLVYYIKKDSLKGIVLTSILLSLFKESYPFAVIGLSSFYLLIKDYKKFIAILATGISLTILIFVIRPMIIGDAFGHGTPIIKNLVNSPVSAITQALIALDYSVIFKLFYPFIIPIIWISRKEIKNKKHFLFPSLFLIAPLFLLHMLVNKFYFQYATSFCATLLAVVIFSNFIKENAKRPKILILTLVLFVTSSSSIYTKMIKFTFFNKTDKCTISEEKNISTQKLLQNLDEIPLSKIVFSTEGVIPRIIKPGRKIYARNPFGKILDSYDYLLLERNHSGDIYPLSKEQVEAIEYSCKQYFTKVIQSDQFYLLAEGNLPKNCILSN